MFLASDLVEVLTPCWFFCSDCCACILRSSHGGIGSKTNFFPLNMKYTDLFYHDEVHQYHKSMAYPVKENKHPWVLHHNPHDHDKNQLKLEHKPYVLPE